MYIYIHTYIYIYIYIYICWPSHTSDVLHLYFSALRAGCSCLGVENVPGYECLLGVQVVGRRAHGSGLMMSKREGDDDGTPVHLDQWRAHVRALGFALIPRMRFREATCVLHDLISHQVF